MQLIWRSIDFNDNAQLSHKTGWVSGQCGPHWQRNKNNSISKPLHARQNFTHIHSPVPYSNHICSLETWKCATGREVDCLCATQLGSCGVQGDRPRIPTKESGSWEAIQWSQRFTRPKSHWYWITLPMTSNSSISSVSSRADMLPVESTDEFQEIHKSLKRYRNLPCLCLLAFILEREFITSVNEPMSKKDL